MVNKLKYQDTNQNFIKMVVAEDFFFLIGDIFNTKHKNIHPNI